MLSSKRWLMASAAAVAVFAANSALAQQNPPKKPAASSAAADADKTDDNTTEVESVVVTGTFLRGTPETATIPVEGYNLEQIRNQGSPSNMDFVKNLSEIGQVFGESNRAATLGNGQQTINLRSLGASRTVVVFNGRRLNEEYSFGLGRSNNIATIPSCAIGRVEVLKDGGGTTYGADAVGGVVNYITRRNFEGLEAQAQYRYIDGSNGGDYSTCITYGKRFDKGNFQISVGYNHRSILPVLERDWAFVPYLKNPGSWSGDSNPGSYQLVNSIGGPFGNQPITPGGPVSAVSGGLIGLFGATVGGQMAADLRYPTTTDLQVGTAGGIRDPNCTALGGFAGWTGFGQGAQPMCYFANGLQENLVEESDIAQGYAEANWQFSNRFKVHAEYTIYWLDLPRIPLDVFTALVQAYPMQRDKFGNVVTTTTNGQVIAQSQTISTVGSYIVPSYNPAVAEFLSHLHNRDGSPLLSSTQMANWTNATYASPYGIGLPQNTWRPFAIGGGAGGGNFDTQDNRSLQQRWTLEFSGDIGHGFFGNWDWDAAVTHGWGNYFLTANDILVDRLQAALNGFGGPNCVGAPGDFGQGNKNPVTLVNGVPTPTVAPGTNGCQYLNPFPSAFAKNTATGQTNPGFVGTGTYQGYTPGMGLQNDPALVKWLYSEQETNYPGQFDVIDLLLRGDLDYHLWAKDPIQVAIGAQYRERHTVTDINNIGDARINPCATPGYGALPGFGGNVGDPTCQNRNGPVLYRRNFNISGTSQDYDRRYPVESAFGEVKVPVTSKLNTQASVRWEKYFSDLGAQDNAVVVTGWGARYQLTDDVAFRATAQQSFSQANPLGPAPPVVSVSTVPTSFGGSTGVTYESWNVPNTEVKPERGLNYNVGGIFQIGNDVTATLDYYNISIGSVIDPGGLSATTVINAVAVQGQTGPSTLINCDSELITRQQSALGGHAFVELAPGFTCVQGQTTMLAALSAKGPNNEPTVVRFFGAQGQERRTFNGGSLDTSGVDANVRWRLPNPVFGGDLSVTGDLSYILTYEVGSFKIAGIPYSVAYDGIGYVNNGSQRPGGQRIYPWRGSLTFNFHKGRHNFNWSTRFVSSITNNDVNLINGSTSALPGSLNANIGDVGGNYVSAACTTDMVNYPPIPDAAGTGIYGARGFIGGTAGNQVAYGYNPCQNGGVRIGDKLRAQSTSSLTWRVQLPKDVDFTLTVDNVFDQQPAFSRDGLNYDSSSSVSPLGRTYQVSVRKTF